MTNAQIKSSIGADSNATLSRPDPMARGSLSFRTGMVAFAWYVWEIGSTDGTRLGWV